MTFGTRDVACSASVVTSSKGNSVWTAGHCLHDGEWASNVVFVPQYRDGNAPYGIWEAERLWSLEGWVNRSDPANALLTEFAYDIGVVKVRKLNGKTLQSTVGSLGITFNFAVDGKPPKTDFVEAFGYPRKEPYGGRELVGCESKRVHLSKGRFNGISVTWCPAKSGSGSSGGPVISDDRWLSGVHSFALPSEPRHAYHATFGQGALNLWRATKNS